MGMAYLDFPSSDAPAMAMRPRVIDYPSAGLDDRERGALMLARTDGRQTLRSPGRLRRLSHICFGFPRRPNKLADPRLEGLRRYAVVIAHGPMQSVLREREHLIGLGFSDQQILASEATATRFRSASTGGLRNAFRRAMAFAMRSSTMAVIVVPSERPI